MELLQQNSPSSGGFSLLPSDSALVQGALAGACAGFVHDVVMTPFDVAKQRMQLLGSYRSTADCMRHVVQTEGGGALFRSLPTVLFMNLPYQGVLVAVNEALKRRYEAGETNDTGGKLFSGIHLNW